MSPAAYWHARAALWRLRAARATEDARLPGLGQLERARALCRARDAREVAARLDGLAASGAPASAPTGKDSRPGGH